MISVLANCSDYPVEVKNMLRAAGPNRTELEKVIDHYKQSGDLLKLEAAYFLIANMSYHYFLHGEGLQAYEEAYRIMADEPVDNRNALFNSLELRIAMNFSAISDNRYLQAELLIKSIDAAFSIWNEMPWSDGFDFNLFCDYFLPYRISSERPTLWREAINADHTGVLNSIWFDRGVKYEAEEAVFKTATVMKVPMASGNYVVKTGSENGCSVKFEVKTHLPGKWMMFIHYVNGGPLATRQLFINDTDNGTVRFKSTGNWSTFGRPVRVPVTFNEGLNRIVFANCANKAAIDYIRIFPVLPSFFGEDIGITIGAEYQISNKQYQQFVLSSTNNWINGQPVSWSPEGSLVDFIIGYTDFGFYSISVNNGDSGSICLSYGETSLKNEAGFAPCDDNYVPEQQWAIIPAEENFYYVVNKLDGKHLGVRPDITEEMKLTATEFTGCDGQLWQFDKRNPPGFDFRSEPVRGSIVDAAHRIRHIISDFEYIPFGGPVPVNIVDLYRYKTGNCREEAQYILSILRSLGIPSAIDFTPHWGNRSMGHEWPVIFNEKGETITYYASALPGEDIFYQYKSPKVFRRTFSVNPVLLSFLSETGGNVPDIFKDVTLTDVTPQYIKTADVEIDLPEAETKGHSWAYLCVFDNNQWVPVHWSPVTSGTALFEGMGVDIVYMPAYYTGYAQIPAGEPFLLEKNGSLRYFEPDAANLQTMILHRKYPYFSQNDFFNERMKGGRFQGSDCPGFSVSNDLYIFDQVTEYRWYTLSIADDRAYRYLRYLGPDGSHCNINELEFFDKSGNKLTGKVIGTKGSYQSRGAIIEKVFDNDILTGFNAPEPDGAWVGLELNKPSRVGTIRFIPRNDGNVIEKGDAYELVYWHHGWNTAGNKIATSDSIVFENIPSGGLYILHNRTKGIEQRIFSYEDGMQVWW